MPSNKGANLEEVVRAYFAQQGFYALRGVDFRFENENVTDIDVWLYGRHSVSVRTRTIVDVKDKRSPKAFERILWARGMKIALGCDRAIVATTNSNPTAKRFAQEQNVGLLHKDFLRRLQDNIDTSSRVTAEQFADLIKLYAEQKLDGDWLGCLADAKSALVSLNGYPAFNKAISSFQFFADRVGTRPKHKQQAVRSAYVTAGLACIALDSALEQTLYENPSRRYEAIANGVTYGDAGDAKVQNSIDTVLDVISSSMDNGRVISRQAKDSLDELFKNVRADIIAEYFSCEHNAASLFSVAKELDDRAHCADNKQVQVLSAEAKSVLGVFADFVQVKRGVLFLCDDMVERKTGRERSNSTQSNAEKCDGAEKDKSTDSQVKLL